MKRRGDTYRGLIQSQRWVKLRARKIAADPLCEDCLLKDITRIAEEVHHVRPIESAPDEATMEILCFDYNNLRSLCRQCHKAAHIALKSYTKEESKKRSQDKTSSFMGKFLTP